MTAVILPFPAYHVRIVREHPAWLVIVRDHGWLHGSRVDAAADARWLATNHGVPIIDRSADRPRSTVRQQHKEGGMAFQQKPNRGSLFKNDEKSREEDRDYAGSINVEGREFWLSGHGRPLRSPPPPDKTPSAHKNAETSCAMRAMFKRDRNPL